MKHSLFIVMGVSGCGKTTMARLFAQSTGGTWLDADTFHSAANITKMSADIPLTDADRQPWLKTLNVRLRGATDSEKPLFLACSALKQSYRDCLVEGLSDVAFVYLRGSLELTHSRMAMRKNHFMPVGLLESQFAELEEPKNALVLDIARSSEQLVEDFRRAAEQGLA